MDDERLDWGNDDEDQPIASALDHHAYDADPQADDGEDAVSLGDEDDGPDHSYFTPSKLHQRLESPREEAPGDGYLTSLEDDADRRVQEDGSPRAHQSSPRFSPSRRRGQPTALTHALPPKPQWDPATMDSLIAVTYAPKPVSMTTTRSNKQRPNGANPNSADSTEPLPQDWEAKQSRNEDGRTYYYNSRTRERTWERPFATTAGEPSSPAWSNDRHGRDGWSARQRDGSPRGSDHHNVLSNGRESGGAQDSFPQDSYQASRSFEERPHRSFGHSHSRRHDFSPQDEVQDSRGRARAPDRLPPQAAGLPSAADSSARGFSDRDGPYGQSGSRHGRASHRDDPSRIVPQKDRLPAQGYGAPDFSNNQYPGDSFSRERPRRPDAAPERGRRLSTSFPPSSASQDALVQDHYIGRSSTLRHRSPPPRSSDRSRHYERGYSPPPPDASSTVQPSRTRRAASPAGGRPTGASHRPAYEQPDVLPQRRPAPDYDDDYDSSKRRRVEGSGSDSALARRPPADTGSHSFRESAMVPISTADHPRTCHRRSVLSLGRLPPPTHNPHTVFALQVLDDEYLFLLSKNASGKCMSLRILPCQAPRMCL
ncbi:hypothetical protein OF83DRAFT_897690 [Amylostereum chailletii]|nr:hypothetical protein OF83DRAFT_897690 [Amylostereum chailletii]